MRASLHSLDEIRGQSIPELINIAAIDFPGAAKRDVNNVFVQEEEVLRNARSAWVIGVQASDESGWMASRVELIVDGALREDGAFEGVEHDLHLGCLGTGIGVWQEGVLKHHTGLDLALDDGEPFGSARVDVRGVH